jgi:hypothetical protein
MYIVIAPFLYHRISSSGDSENSDN